MIKGSSLSFKDAAAKKANQTEAKQYTQEELKQMFDQEEEGIQPLEIRIQVKPISPLDNKGEEGAGIRVRCNMEIPQEEMCTVLLQVVNMMSQTSPNTEQ